MSDETAVAKSETTPVPGAALPATREEAAKFARLDLEVARERAKVAAEVITEMKLFKKIGNKKFVFVDGWTTLAALYRMSVTIAWTKVDDDGVAYARAELVNTVTGEILVGAESECGGKGDDTWINRTAMAKRSMAQTRATSKVCRQALSWVMVLAGFQGTPAEEMEREDGSGGARGEGNGTGESGGSVTGKSTRVPAIAQLRLQANELVIAAIKDGRMKHAQMEEWVNGISKGVFVRDGTQATFHRTLLDTDQCKTIIAALLPRAPAEDDTPPASPAPDDGAAQAPLPTEEASAVA